VLSVKIESFSLDRPHASAIAKNLIEREIREVGAAIEWDEQILADQSIPERLAVTSLNF
jgi:hypothetical protein